MESERTWFLLVVKSFFLANKYLRIPSFNFSHISPFNLFIGYVLFFEIPRLFLSYHFEV